MAPARPPTKNDDVCKHPIIDAINAAIERDQEDPRRRHLGGSLIGRKCSREIWYGFRWASKTLQSGRMLRLFNRGHREEARFVEWLRRIGVELYEYAPPDYVLLYHDGSDCYILKSVAEWEQTQITSEPLDDVTGDPLHERAARERGVEIPEPKQIRILDVMGHFGGSLDGIGRYFPGVTQLLGLPQDEWGLTEFKTHGEKSFNLLIEKGVKAHKPEHVAQMQIYMKKRGLRFGVYLAICKNTDRMWCEFVLADHMAGEGLIAKAKDIVHSSRPPKKLSQSPAWFECKFCDYRRICHMGEAMDKNCRTCVNSVPAVDGRWYCNLWKSLIPQDAEKDGCSSWQEIKD